MNCKKCGALLYKNLTKCLRCGYSESESELFDERESQRFVISKNHKINNLYLKIFGQTDKRTVIRVSKYLMFLFFLLLIFYHLFLYIDIPNKCFITIRPALTELSNTTIKKGIRYLKSDFPNEYSLFCENVNTINPNISCGGFGGGCFYEISPKMIDVSTTFGNHINAAKVIIHETCHVIQFKEGRPLDESECYAKDSIIPWFRKK